MTGAGLPVPPGFVVPAGVLERSVDADRLRALAVGRSHADAHALVLSAEPPRESHRRGVRAPRAGPRRRSLVGHGRGLRSGELRRSAGDLPERRRGRQRLRPRRRLLGVVLQRAGALLPGAQGLARGSRDGRGRPEDGRRRQGRRSVHRRPGTAPARPDADRGCPRARRAGGVGRGHARPLRHRPSREGKRSNLPNGGVLDEAELRDLAELGIRLEQHFGGAPGRRVGDRERAGLPPPVAAR